MVRTMKKMNEMTILWYTNWAALLMCLPFPFFFSKDPGVFWRFSVFDWCILGGTSLSKLVMMLFKIKALQLQSAAKLQILSPIQTVVTFAGQILLFH